MKTDSERGTLRMERVESRVLRGNPLGDPAVRDVPVYLPPDYARGSKRYPVIYMLTGFTGSGRMLLNFSHFTEPLDVRLDRLIGSGAMKPVIVVMPDCFTSFGGSQYLNSSATGRYADHLVREIVPWADRTFRTLPEAGHRAVAGKSSGGYGAMVHGMWHPDVFGAVACHSGDMCFEYCYLPDFPKAATELGRAGGVEKWLRRFRSMPRKPHPATLVLNILAMAACYSPNRRAPLGVDLPFDIETGELRANVWQKWLALDPLRMLPAHAAALRGLRLLYVDAGTRDEWNLHLGARMFAQHATALGLRHVHQEFDDGHMDISYRYDVSLPMIARAIA